MSLQEALEAPRFFKNNAPGCDVYIESRVPEQTLQQLSERGHQIRIGREYVETMGRGQAILHNSKTGMNYAASDPRADGAAIPGAAALRWRLRIEQLPEGLRRSGAGANSRRKARSPEPE